MRLAEDLRKSGMDDEQISVIMKKEEGSPGYDPNRPTHTRMSRRHLCIETLNAYRIDYEFDEVCKVLTRGKTKLIKSRTIITCSSSAGSLSTSRTSRGHIVAQNEF